MSAATSVITSPTNGDNILPVLSPYKVPHIFSSPNVMRYVLKHHAHHVYTPSDVMLTFIPEDKTICKAKCQRAGY